MMFWKLTLILAAFLVLIYACSTEEPATEITTRTTIFNPNGDSELALLMRFMYDDMERVKKSVESGEKTQLTFDPYEMFTADPTDSAQVATEHYKAMGKAFIAAYNAFQQTDPSNLAQKYSVVVQYCMTCHQSTCPGPMRRIENLYLASR